MVEAWAEKRVVISPDPTALADSVAARFLNRVAKRVDERRARPHLAHRRHHGLRGARGGGAQPAPRPHRLVARALLVERRALRAPRRRRPQREAGARGAARRARHPRREHPRRSPRATTASIWMPRPQRYAAELAALRRRRRTVAVVRRVLPRRRTRRAHRVAVPRPPRDPHHRPRGRRGARLPQAAAGARQHDPPGHQQLAARLDGALRRRQGVGARASPSPGRATRACRPPAPRGASARCSSSTRPPPSQVPPELIDREY